MSEKMKAPIREIFCSVQGEGSYTGVRQAFIRFARCNLECAYCDTPLGDVPECRVQMRAGTGKFSKIENPITTTDVSRAVSGYKMLHSIALTGGEPLLYADFIKEMDLACPLYLETNMSLPERAKIIKEKIRYVAGDFKLKAGYNLNNYDEYFRDMVKCFKVLRNTGERDCFCKIVLPAGFDKENLFSGVSKIKDCISLVVLQPVTNKKGGDSKAVSVRKIMEIQEALLDMIDTRVIPQSHILWGAL